MAKTVKYKIVRWFFGSVVHTSDPEGNAITIELTDNTPQELLEMLYNKGYEGVTI